MAYASNVYMQLYSYIHFQLSICMVSNLMHAILFEFVGNFGGTFRMAQLVSGCFYLNANDFIECSCPDYVLQLS